jgi:hypothetical protein
LSVGESSSFSTLENEWKIEDEDDYENEHELAKLTVCLHYLLIQVLASKLGFLRGSC